jgi:hypothetical protein
VTLNEPVTALTDYAAALVSLGFALSMYRRVGPGQKVTAWFWCASFLAGAGAATLGGTFHGFMPALSRGAREGLWSGSMVLIGVSVAFVAAAVHSAHVRRVDRTVHWLVAGIVVSFAGLAVQQSTLRLGFLNHNDIYHLIQIIGLYLLFRCAGTTRDRGSFTASVVT